MILKFSCTLSKTSRKALIKVVTKWSNKELQLQTAIIKNKAYKKGIIIMTPKPQATKAKINKRDYIKVNVFT